MCGIFGYTGKQEVVRKLINGLSRLEYRGYDSAGMAVLNNGIKLKKNVGNIASLESSLADLDMSGYCGVSHTRWATHGKANEQNAHPHLSNNKQIALVHNGIIDNYQKIKGILNEKGYEFQSETDTEVLVNYLEDCIGNSPGFPAAISKVLAQLSGSYAFAFIHKNCPGEIWAARSGAPLVVGIHGDDDYYISSDLHAFRNDCEEAIFMEDHHYVKLESGQKPIFYNFRGERSSFEVLKTEKLSEWDDSDHHSYDYITLKEIHEQPGVMRRLLLENDHFEEINKIDITSFRRIILLGCGTSLNAALLAKRFIEDAARIPVNVEQASEFKYSNPILFQDDLVIGISQSGETADTLQACYVARDKGIKVIGLTNSPFSTITRELDACIYLKAGKEIGVASTKAFTAQIMAFLQLAIMLKSAEGIDLPSPSELNLIPNYMEDILLRSPEIEELAAKYRHVEHFLFIGRGHSFPMAMEGALKLKELSYVHAEAYQAAELKHGPLALVDPSFPVFLLAGDKSNEEKNLASANEVKSRNGFVIAMLRDGETEIASVVDDIIRIPEMPDALVPLASSIPLQLFALYMAVLKGRNVDQPRNLAKSVTVE